MKAQNQRRTTKSDIRLREGGAAFTHDLSKPFSNATITYRGQTMALKDWSTHLGLKYSGVRDRLVQGWPINEAVAMTRGERRTTNSNYTNVITAVLPKKSK